MRRNLLALALLLIGASVCLSTAAQPLKRSIIKADKVTSKILGQDVPYNVYLPSGYDEPKSYPIIYLLHGLSDTYTCWDKKGRLKDVADELIGCGELRPVVIITPNAGDPDTRNIPNGYFNMPGHNYEDFFFQEFLPTVEERYHIISDKGHRAIMGLSMGGGGSTVYCQHHPELFSSCYSMSGWLDNKKQEKDIITSKNKDWLYLTGESVAENSAIDFVAKADEATLEKLRTVKWFFDCGDDDFILDLTIDMYRQMRDHGVKSELRIRDGWHFWEYWHNALRLSLPFASRNFDQP